MGVFGVYGVNNAASVVYYGLHALQHRGQEGAGIATFTKDGQCCHQRGEGLVSEVFSNKSLGEMLGEIGMGSTQYTNAKKGGLDNVEPLFFRHHSGEFVIAAEGNLINAESLTTNLEERGSLLHSSTISEILANLIKKKDDENRILNISEALNLMEGGFTFLVMTKNRLYACRDRYGIKPLCLGKLGDAYVVSSESCAFELIGAEFVRDFEPGEIMTIDKKGIRTRNYSSVCHHDACAMEYIYLARPDSDIDGCNVHEFRKESGRRLYRECPADADIVIGVPDSSLSAAMGYSEESGIPYEMGLVKNKYMARTFINPDQSMREKGVLMKLSAVGSIVKGKRVVVVDDSIVRGNTSRIIVALLREAGAKEIHVRIASPMMKYPCFYGVDTSDPKDLLCNEKTLEQACEAIHADSLGYMSCESMLASTMGCTGLCMACFNGDYPTKKEKNKQ